MQASAYTAADVLAKLVTVDGAGSDIDAEYLAGQPGSYYAPVNGAALTGNPTAPTQTAGNSSTRLATTAFVSDAVQAIIEMAPSDLDTLAEIATRLEGSEDNYAALVTTIAGKLAKASNLNDLTDAAAARANLSLGNVPNVDATNADNIATGTLAAARIADGSLPVAKLTGLTKSSVGLGNVDNTSDANKPISTATQTALDGKQPAGKYRSWETKTASYVLVADDRGRAIEMNVAGANTVTTAASGTHTAGDTIDVYNLGAGQVTITAGSGIALRGGKYKISQNGAATLAFRTSSEVWVKGDVVA